MFATTSSARRKGLLPTVLEDSISASKRAKADLKKRRVLSSELSDLIGFKVRLHPCIHISLQLLIFTPPFSHLNVSTPLRLGVDLKEHNPIWKTPRTTCHGTLPISRL
jgi:hypothetical protein